MKEISKDKVYYGYFNDDKTTIKAYKVINIVYDIETKCYTLTLNIANEGVTKVCKDFWEFYTSPLNVVSERRDFILVSILHNLASDIKSYVDDFKKALEQNGFSFSTYSKNEILCWVFDTDRGHINYQYQSIYELCSKFISGKYNLFTQEFEGFRFKKVWCTMNGKRTYKSKEECLDAQMPKVVEFEDNPQTEYVVHEFKVTITAKNEDEASKKLAKMLDLMDNL